MTIPSQPIEIIGGGLAGLSLGLALRRRGVDVTLFEAGDYPRHRVCGEFITGLAPSTISRLGLEPVLAGALRHHEVAWFLDDTDHPARIQLLPSPALGLSRYALDARLAGAFVAAGGNLCAKTRITEFASRPGRVFATGRRRSRPAWIGLKIHARSLRLTRDLELHLGENAYVGLSRIETGAVNVCGLFRRRTLCAKGADLLLGYLQAAGLNGLAARVASSALDAASFCAVAAVGFDRSVPPTDRIRLGDACAMIPPFTGNGMAMAFQCAEIAVEPLLAFSHGARSWSATCHAINPALRRHFRLRLATADALHSFLLAPPRQQWLRTLNRARLLPLRPLYSALHLMYLHALATAVPPARYAQTECWDILQRSPARARLSKRSRLILHSILTHDHGIATRHFAVPEIDRVFDLSPDELNAAFRTASPQLAARALTAALASAGLPPAELDALIICTCTGYICPGLTSYVAEQLGLRTDAFLQDLVGLGCGAAIPSLRAASHVLAADPGATVACVAVEVCSAAFYLDDDPGVLISACLFSDGAAATIWRADPGDAGLRAFDFNTIHLPAARDKLRFEQREGKLRNLLDPGVPTLAAGAVEKLWSARGPRPVSRVVAHTGGRDVLSALAPIVAPHTLDASVRVLRSHGNMSSPSVLFALDETLRETAPTTDGDFWLVSFGAGFSAHSCRLGSGD